MKFADWMDNNGWTPKKLATKLKTVSRQRVAQWRYTGQVPKKHHKKLSKLGWPGPPDPTADPFDIGLPP